ncbi:pectate lyase [Cellvibrio sp. NN19]|uniref:pectate lyase family protein n=1 Tax=Cellvibrio chitinivorans TaxID=3102792 RepID=UPI002B408534|nr:pectate lyase [Cellvibrio sp. NN19]
MSTFHSSTAQKNAAGFTLKTMAAAVALCAGSTAFAAASGGFATTDGGNVSGAKSFTAATYQEINTIIANARLDSSGNKVTGGAYPLIITYTGNEDSLINQIVKDHTVDANGNCPKAHWNDAYREVQIKEFTKGITIQGANGSSANFGITLIKSENVIIRNMKIGALGGANNDADMLRVDNTSNVWIDHNELFAVNNECNGSPDGDLTFESALDIKKDSKNVTVSYNNIHDSKKVGLDGHTSVDFQRNITFHHNIYKNVNARLPLQRGGWTHMYNNHYDGITGSGINVRQGGYALIENNYFENALNPVTCRYDSSNCGFWDLRNNNVKTPGDFATYNITWSSGGTVDATNWTTTAPFPISLPYSYSPVSADCVKSKLASYAGVGKNGAQLTSSACGTSTSSAASSVAVSSSSKSSSSVAVSSSSVAVSSSSKSSSSSSVASSAGGAPVLTGTGDYPTGFSKCADLGGTCSVTSGDGWVAFGRKGNWVVKKVSVPGSIACTVAAFGSDPQGNPNKCSYKK